MQDIEKRVIGKVMWRLIPFLIVCYFVAYLDRVNVGFAKLHMNEALGLSEAAFGLGAGLFFVGYFLFEVPSNIFLEKVGARVWIGPSKCDPVIGFTRSITKIFFFACAAASSAAPSVAE